MTEPLKVLYIYSGSRRDKFSGTINVDYPDTQFYGLNHLNQFGIKAEYKEWSDVTSYRFLGKILGFRLKHILLYPFTKGKDVVFGSSILFVVAIKKIFKTSAKFVLLNIGLTRTLIANKKNPLKYRFITWLLRDLDGIVCLTHVQKEYIEENFPFLKEKIYVVPLGVDTTFYHANAEERKDYILSAGRDNGRDYKTLIETARLMPEKVFHIVCSSRNMIGIENIPNNVNVFYDLPVSELQKKYKEACILVLTTHDDTFQDGADCSGQTVLLDALASGLPVIASRKRYLADYVDDKKEVILVDFYDPLKLKIAIESLDNVGLRKVMAMRARERVEREFSTKKMAQNLAYIFKDIHDHTS